MRLLKQSKGYLETIQTRKLSGQCDECRADFKTAGGSLESYEMKSGDIKTLCHYCAIELVRDIKQQPNTFELTSGKPLGESKPLKLGELAFLK